MKSHKVTVVITTYNRPVLLERAIRSVLNQTYENFECVVVDDCSSTHKAKEITQKFTDNRVTYTRHEQNMGLSAARNTGIEYSDGEYVAFLDDDDQWKEKKLEKQIDLFEGLEDKYAIVYCWMNYRRHTDEEIINSYCPSYEGNIFSEALEGQPIGSGSTLLVRRSIAKNTKFDVDIDRGIDGDFIRRVCQEYYVNYVPEILVEYYVEHGKDRITSQDESGIRDAISGHKIKFDKFSTELNARPQCASRILAKIAYHYAQLGEWRMSIKYYQKALSTSPTTLIVYRSILKKKKTGIDHYGHR